MDAGVRSTVKFRTISIALTFGIAACAAFSLAAQKKPSAAGPVVFAQDKGKLTIKLGGQTVGQGLAKVELSSYSGTIRILKRD